MSDRVLDPEATPRQVVVPPPVLDVVIPVHNEEAQLADSVRIVVEHLDTLPWSWQVTIADNASTDGTAVIAHRLARDVPGVHVLHLTEKGRGRALQQAWGRSAAEVLVYMDVDLSTDLRALLPLVAPLVSGHSDVAIGSRLAPTSRVRRGLKRELISRGYNRLLRWTLRARFSDAQCGFKAIRRDVARQLLPRVEDTGWFFDTELLMLAQRDGRRVHEVPVDWVDDPDSRVDVVRTAVEDLRGILRLGGGRLARFLLVGAASTLAYSGLYLLLSRAMPALVANFLALLVTAVANTTANRRFTFSIRGRRHAWRHQLKGLLVFVSGLAATSAALSVAHDNPPAVQVAVLTVVNLAVTGGRYVAYRNWVFWRSAG
jgi:putative flippase GtrA